MNEREVVLYCTVCGQRVRVPDGDWIDPERFRCGDRARHLQLERQQLALDSQIERVERVRYDPEQAAIPW